jgi:hypothetical protein
MFHEALINGTGARRTLLQILKSYPKQTWQTVGDITEDLYSNWGYTVETPDGRRHRLADLPQRERYGIVKKALETLRKSNKLDSALGDERGREVRAYKTF